MGCLWILMLIVPIILTVELSAPVIACPRFAEAEWQNHSFTDAFFYSKAVPLSLSPSFPSFTVLSSSTAYKLFLSLCFFCSLSFCFMHLSCYPSPSAKISNHPSGLCFCMMDRGLSVCVCVSVCMCVCAADRNTKDVYKSCFHDRMFPSHHLCCWWLSRQDRPSQNR